MVNKERRFMKKLINTSFVYTILALVGGVFYREFTKYNDFTGKTTLAFIHTHLFMLGMVFFLIVLLLNKQYALTDNKNFGKFFIIYNIGVALSTIMFVVRGVLQVLQTPLTKGLTASISGVSGIGHILISVGLIWFFIILKKQAIKS